MVSHLIGSYSYTQVENLLFFPNNGHSLQKEGIRLVIHLLFITHLLEDSDLGRLRQVNRSWNLLILNNPKFVNRMLVTSLLFAARQTARKIEDKWLMNLLLLSSFKLEIRHDFRKAQERLKSGDFFLKIEALLEIAKIDPQHNFAPAKTHALAINNFRTRDKEITKIVELEAKYNLIDAKATAEAISSESGEKAKALLKIIQVEVRSNLNDAKATAQAILETKYYDRNYFEAMTEIVKIEAQSNIEAAEATAQSIPIEIDRKQIEKYSKKRLKLILTMH
jgi:hypothetical protein